MYTSSTDHGATWSKPVDVNPERAGDAHMWPCLSCNRHGDLIGGSLVYDETLSKYSILVHSRACHEDEWTSYEADNAPWSAGGPSPGFRIGFGDYFDCDSLPNGGISVMAWSETPTGAQPWQTWARVLDMCQFEEDRVDALEAEIKYLTDALERRELPARNVPGGIEKFRAQLDQLQERLRTERTALEARRAINPLPVD